MPKRTRTLASQRRSKRPRPSLSKPKLWKYLDKHIYHPLTKRRRRLRRWCLRHLATYLQTAYSASGSLWHVLTHLNWHRCGLTLRSADPRSERSYHAIRNRLASVGEGARSTLHRCHGCQSTDVDYYQKQCRSADEPMTTFFTCLDCSARWRQ